MVHLVGEILGWMENGLEKNREKIDLMSIFSLSLITIMFSSHIGGKTEEKIITKNLDEKSPPGIV